MRLAEVLHPSIPQMQTVRPRVFIGSSTEALSVARAIQVELETELDTTIWYQGVFGPSASTLESLDHLVRDFDAAVLVLTPDDVTGSRGGMGSTPRDNVLYELGLFAGALGRHRVFIVRPRDVSLELPSDLLGLTVGLYRLRSDGNLQVAVAPACTRIRQAVRTLFSAEEPASMEFGTPILPMSPRRRRRRSLGAAVSRTPCGYHPIVNISETGALIEAHGPLPVGRMIDFDLTLENGESLKVKAAVVRNQPPEWGRTAGIGVMFRDLDERARAALKRYIESDITVS